MSKITIIEPNANDKDQVKAYMVKGERGDDGVSPTFETSKTGDTATITIKDVEGVHEVDLKDGVSPTIETSKTGKVTTLTITDYEGVKTATINDGEVNVINTFSTQQDKTINAPSINAVEQYLANYMVNYYNSNAIDTMLLDYKLNGDFAVITGTLSSGSATISYPTGFTKDNCVVISTMFSNSTNSSWGNGSVFNSTNVINGTTPNSIRLTSENIIVSTSNIGLANETLPAVSDISLALSFKIVLMKI